MNALFGIVLITVCALALMALEAFIPGISIAGIAGVGLIGYAAYLCFSVYGTVVAIGMLFAAVLASFLVMRAVLHSMKGGKISKSGIFMNDSARVVIKTADSEKALIPGTTGLAKTALHPTGIAEFDGRRVHVVSGNGFIEKGERIIVVRMEGARILVALSDQ